MDLAGKFENILYDSMNNYNAIETMEEEKLDFQEQFKNYEVQAIKDDAIFNEKKDYDVCSYDDEELSFNEKKRAVEYWRSSKTKKNRSIESVKHRFKLVNSEWQLRRWAYNLIYTIC